MTPLYWAFAIFVAFIVLTHCAAIAAKGMPR